MADKYKYKKLVQSSVTASEVKWVVKWSEVKWREVSSEVKWITVKFL